MNILTPLLAVTLAWDASPEPVEGYKLHYGPTQGAPSIHRDFGKVTQATVDNAELPAQSTIFFTATAYNAGLESEPSNEVAYEVPIPVFASLIGVKFGSLDLPQGTQVVVQADPPPAGESFAGWTGDTAILTNPSQPSTTAIIPAMDTKIEATYTSSSTQASAVFVKTDSTTQGSWKGVYGANGEMIANDSNSMPDFATASINGKQYTSRASTTNLRGLQKAASDTDRIESCWYTGGILVIDLNLTDGASHQVAVYFLDIAASGRSQVVTVTDENGVILDIQPMMSFAEGKWLVWNMKGHVKIRIVRTTGPNNVVSGLFL
jgi:Divergent InlB B-repeat domain